MSANIKSAFGITAILLGSSTIVEARINKEFCLFDSSGNVIGIINPSIFHAMVDGRTVINGPAGTFQISVQTCAALEQALRLAGALIPGTSKEVKAVCELLRLVITTFLTWPILINFPLSQSPLTPHPP